MSGIKKFAIISAYFLFVLFITGCSQDNLDENSARLRVKLTDAALPVLSGVNIAIQSIELDYRDSVSSAAENWVPLEYSGGEYNLLKYRNGKTLQIVDQYFPSGMVSRVRITFGDNNTINLNGNDIILQLPDDFNNVLEVDAQITLESSIICSVIIDIDLAQSIYLQNGNYYFEPVARVFMETYGGRLSGAYSPLEANALVQIMKDNTSLVSIPEPDGTFLFSGLEPGEWNIIIVPDPTTGYRDTLFTDSVFAGTTRQILPKPIVLKKIE